MIPENCPPAVAHMFTRLDGGGGSKTFATFVEAGDYSVSAIERCLEEGSWVLVAGEINALREALIDARREEGEY